MPRSVSMPRSPVGKEDVAGLDVAVDDPALVGFHQAARHSRHDRESRLFVEPGPFRQQVAEALAGHEFQDHVRNAVVFVEFQQVDDVGVVGLGHEPGLLAEPPEDLGVVDSVGPQDLDRDDGPRRRILGAIDDPLASLAQLVQQSIAAQPRAVRLGTACLGSGSQPTNG